MNEEYLAAATDEAASVAQELDETFKVTLVNPSAGLLLGTSTEAIGTVQNDDAAYPVFSMRHVRARIGSLMMLGRRERDYE